MAEDAEYTEVTKSKLTFPGISEENKNRAVAEQSEKGRLTGGLRMCEQVIRFYFFFFL